MEINATIARLQVQVGQLIVQGVEKEKEVESLKSVALVSAQELATAQRALFWAQKTRRFLMTTGISEIHRKSAT